MLRAVADLLGFSIYYAAVAWSVPDGQLLGRVWAAANDRRERLPEDHVRALPDPEKRWQDKPVSKAS